MSQSMESQSWNDLVTEQQDLHRVKSQFTDTSSDEKSATFIVGAFQGAWAGAAHVPKT